MTDIVERLRIGRETCGVDMCRTREARSGCTCAEAADEIERLRDALRQCYVLFNDARNGPPNLFKICCEGMRVVRAENVLGRRDG